MMGNVRGTLFLWEDILFECAISDAEFLYCFSYKSLFCMFCKFIYTILGGL